MHSNRSALSWAVPRHQPRRIVCHSAVKVKGSSKRDKSETSISAREKKARIENWFFRDFLGENHWQKHARPRSGTQPDCGQTPFRRCKFACSHGLGEFVARCDRRGRELWFGKPSPPLKAQAKKLRKFVFGLIDMGSRGFCARITILLLNNTAKSAALPTH